MDSLYNRYALGLFLIAQEENKVLEYRNSVKMLKDIMESNVELIHLFSSYFILQDEKEKIVDDVFSQLEEYLRNFLKIIIRNKRVDCMVNIFDEFISLSNDFLKIKEGIVYSTDILSNDEIKRLENRFEEVFLYKVELKNVIDERLIGGIKVVIDDSVFDGSIQNKLCQLKLSLKKGEKNGY